MDFDMTKNSKFNLSAFIWPMRIIGHLSASIIVTCLLVALMTDPGYFLSTMKFSYHLEQYKAETVQSMLMLWGMGACVWAMCVILYALASSRRESLPYRSLKSARGTIMVETVIILPAYFVLMFGMGQFGLNMISASMANVAGYSASRAYWVWAPEVQKNRSGTAVSPEMALDKARIAGALVMAGATPGGNTAPGGSLSEMAEKSRDMTMLPGTGQGSLGGLLAGLVGGSGVGASEVSYYKSFDDQNFLTRGATKFENAYKATEVSPAGSGGVNFKYKMVQTMPIVGSLFGEMDEGRYRMTIERQVTFAAQPYGPNDQLPSRSYDGQEARSEDDGNIFGL